MEILMKTIIITLIVGQFTIVLVDKSPFLVDKSPFFGGLKNTIPFVVG
jgi:hypothetical protein